MEKGISKIKNLGNLFKIEDTQARDSINKEIERAYQEEEKLKVEVKRAIDLSEGNLERLNGLESEIPDDSIVEEWGYYKKPETGIDQEDLSENVLKLIKFGNEKLTIITGNSVIFDSINPIKPNIVYLAEEPINELVVSDFISNDEGYGSEYTIHFRTSETGCTLTLPENILLANGEMPVLKNNTDYELFIYETVVNNRKNYKVIIIPFNILTKDGDYNLEYFTIKTLGEGNVTLYKPTSFTSLEYSVNNEDWTSFSTDTTINVSEGDCIRVKAVTEAYNRGNAMFSCTCQYEVYGNIMSLLYGDDFIGQTVLKGTYSFSGMFNSQSNLLNAENLILPATTLMYGCYEYMFGSCVELVSTPELPATTLASDCYGYMFQGCTSLTSAPELPATTLFGTCYNSMFSGCTGLTEAPELPATTLADSCYRYMFDGCTSLTEAPELPATTLAYDCYGRMFNGCSNLNKITMLATDISASNCLSNWVGGVASKGTFIKHPEMTSLPSGVSGIPDGWTVTNTFNNISPCIINQASESVTFIYSDGLFTPTNEVIGLSQYFTKEELLSVQPECEIIVTLLDKTDNVLVSDYAWANDKTLSDVLNELGVTKDIYDINVIITNVNAPEDSGYYYYNTIEENPYSKEFFTIEALELGVTVRLSNNASEYRIDNGEWISLGANTATPEINTGQKISFKITNPTISTYIGIGTFTVNGYFNVEGNIMSLLYGDDFEGQIDLSGKDGTFKYLFNSCTTLQNAENLILPAITLATYCYADMFSGCTRLTAAPQLPATTLANSCYLSMFYNCTSLTESPELPATTLATECYYYMFYGCSKLNKITMLATDISASNCLSNWVKGVASRGTFVKDAYMTLLPSGTGGIPNGWTVENA